MRIEIDVVALWSTKQRSLGRLFRQHLLQLFRQFNPSFLDDAELFEPAVFVHEKPRELDIDHRVNAFKLELRAPNQRLTLQTLNQLFPQRHQDCGIARGVLQLGFGKLEIPVAKTLTLVDGLDQVTARNRLQYVTSLDVAGTHDLTRDERGKTPGGLQ